MAVRGLGAAAMSGGGGFARVGNVRVMEGKERTHCSSCCCCHSKEE
jgi:hypothetical protein